MNILIKTKTTELNDVYLVDNNNITLLKYSIHLKDAVLIAVTLGLKYEVRRAYNE